MHLLIGEVLIEYLSCGGTIVCPRDAAVSRVDRGISIGSAHTHGEAGTLNINGIQQVNVCI